MSSARKDSLSIFLGMLGGIWIKPKVIFMLKEGKFSCPCVPVMNILLQLLPW
jgi:hypothetical protein